MSKYGKRIGIEFKRADVPGMTRSMSIAQIVGSRAEDIVYTSLIRGVHGNYLRGSIEKAGMDPDRRPERGQG